MDISIPCFYCLNIKLQSFFCFGPAFAGPLFSTFWKFAITVYYSLFFVHPFSGPPFSVNRRWQLATLTAGKKSPAGTRPRWRQRRYMTDWQLWRTAIKTNRLSLSSTCRLASFYESSDTQRHKNAFWLIDWLIDCWLSRLFSSQHTSCSLHLGASAYRQTLSNSLCVPRLSQDRCRVAK